MKNKIIVCIDIGGGTTRIGFSQDKKTFENIVKFSTTIDFDEEINNIIEEIRKFTDNPEKIVIAAAGSVNSTEGTVISWGQRKDWKGRSFFKPIKMSFPASSLILENDADVAGLGEAVFGAGKNYSLVAYITLSTGVGGGLIINKKIVPHKIGFEPGDLILNPGGPMGNTEIRGDFEAYSSGTAFKRIYGMKGEDCNDPEIWEKYTDYLSIGLANVLFMWSPEVLILGGGVSVKFDSFIEPLKQKLESIHQNFIAIDIVKFELHEPGLYGGLAL